jgi:hypothetical protein
MSTEFEQAARLSGDNPEMRFWQSERIEDGLLVLCEIVARNPNWRETRAAPLRVHVAGKSADAARANP